MFDRTSEGNTPYENSSIIMEYLKLQQENNIRFFIQFVGDFLEYFLLFDLESSEVYFPKICFLKNLTRIFLEITQLADFFFQIYSNEFSLNT